jgi:hypothetical protein
LPNFLSADHEQNMVLSTNIENFVNSISLARAWIKESLTRLQTVGKIDMEKTIKEGDGLKKKKQKFYTKILDMENICMYEEAIFSDYDIYHKVRLHGIEGSWASAWLYSVPQNKQSILHNNEFRHAMKFRLGIPFNDKPSNCLCQNKNKIDENKSHLLTCRLVSGSWIRRHNCLADDLKTLCNTAHVNVTDFGLTMNDNKRTDLRFQSLGSEGKDIEADLSIVFSGAESYLSDYFSNTKGKSIQSAEEKKITKHKPNCDSINVEFIPLVIDAFGRPSETFISFISGLIRHASEVTHIP